MLPIPPARLVKGQAKAFARKLREGKTYRICVEKIVSTKEDNRMEWTDAVLVKKYPYIALFRIGDSRRETFMYKELYTMFKNSREL